MVSVIIPIYNKENELARCIDSVIHQTYSDCEIILVDDGSTDHSLEICRQYEKTYINVVVVRQKNGGVSSARNSGIEHASGKWIMFVDPDDFIFPDAIDELIAYEETGAEIIAACLCTYCVSKTDYSDIDFDQVELHSSKMSFYDDNYLFCDTCCINSYGLKGNKKKELFLELFNDNYGSSGYRMNGIGTPCVKLYNRQFLDTNQLLFDPELIRMQDNIFNMFAFLRSEKVVYIDKTLYVYDISHKKMFQRKYDPNAVHYYNRVLQIRNEFIKDYLPKDEDYYNEFSAGVVEITSAILKHYFLNADNPSESSQIKREMAEFFSSNIYEKAFNNKKKGKVRPLMDVRAWLLKHGMYDALFFLERLIVKIKK